MMSRKQRIKYLGCFIKQIDRRFTSVYSYENMNEAISAARKPIYFSGFFAITSFMIMSQYGNTQIIHLLSILNFRHEL